MKKIQFIILTALLSSTYFLNAQDYNFNNYKFRYQKYKGWNNSGSFNQSSGMSADKNDFDTISFSQNKNNNFNYQFNISSDFFSFQNTENLQSSKQFNFFTDNKFERIKDKSKYLFNNFRDTLEFENILIKDFVLRNYFSFNINNRYYKGNKFTMLNYGYRLNHNYTSSNNKIDSLRNNHFEVGLNNENKIQNNANIEVGIGKGRLDNVDDVISAAFIIKDLQQKTGLSNITNEQLEKIAQGITSIRNRRYIDFRFRLIDQLEMLDSVFKANGVSTVKASRYFTTLNDNWLYAIQLNRFSGSRYTLSYAFLPGLDWNHRISQKKNNYYFDENYQKENYQKIDNSIRFEYVYSIQKNMYVQNQFTLSLTMNYEIGKRSYNEKNWRDYILNNEYEAKNNISNLRPTLNIQYNYLYQPDSRTFLRFNVAAGSNFNMFKIVSPNTNTTFFQNDNNQSFYYNIVSGIEYFRFINARLSYSIGGSMNYRNFAGLNKFTNNNNSNTYIQEFSGFVLGQNFYARVFYAIF